ncbi:MAG: hypothetical protein K2K21_07510 [Lachnospiraceae bacterium]|nr:hypothetical protein [Lachnospiraceae bacterium]
MIFKTFDSNIDKISSKWGMFGRSFNDISTAIVGRITDINKAFQATDDLIGSIKYSDSIWKRLYPNKESIKAQLIDVDSLIPEINKDNFDFDFWINKLNDVDKKVKAGTMSWQDFSNSLDDNQKWIAKWGQETEGQIRTQSDLVKANQQARASALAHNEAIKAQTFSAKAGKVALQALATAGNMIAMWAISKGLELAVKGIDELAHSTEHCAERVDELMSNYQSALDKANSNAKTIEDLASRYEELSKGVNNLGENVSLTTDEYSEYNDIVNQIADMFPTLIQGYTNEGNAILSLKGNVEQLRDAYKEAQQEAYNLIINDKNSNDIIKNANNILNVRYSGTGFHGRNRIEAINFLNKLIEATASIDDMSNLWNESVSNGYSGLMSDFIYFGDNFTVNELTSEQLMQIKNQAKTLIQTYQAEIDSALQGVQTLANAYLMTNDDYAKLDETTKNAISIIVNSIDENVASGFKNSIDVGTYVTNIVDTIKDPDHSEIKDALVDLFTLDTSKMSAIDAKELVDIYISRIAEALDENPFELKVRLGFDDIDQTASNYQNILDNAARKASNTTIRDIRNQTGNYKEYQEIYDAIDDFANEYSINTQDEIAYFQDALEEAEYDINKAFELYLSKMQNDLDVDDFTPTISSSVEQISRQLEPQYATLGDAYSSIFPDDGFNPDVVDNPMLKNLLEAFTEIDEEVGVTFDTNKVNEFFDVIADGSHNAAEVHDAFNDLATAYFYSTDTLEHLNEATAESIKQQLEQMGVVNSEEIIDYYLTLADTKEILANTDEKLIDIQYRLSEAQKDLAESSNNAEYDDAKARIDSIYDEINAYYNQIGASEELRIELLNLQLQRANLNINSINSSDSASELLNLAEAAGLSSEYIEQLIYLQQLFDRYESTTNGDMKSAVYSDIQRVTSTVANELEVSPLELKFDFPSGKASGAASAGKDAAEAYLEGFHNELDRLKFLQDNGFITEKEYLDQLRILYGNYFKDREEYLEEYVKYEHEYLNGLKSLYEDVLGGITDLLDDQIDKIEEERDTKIDALEEEQEARTKALELQKEQLDLQIEEIEAQIKGKNDAIDAINDEIDAIKEANDERQRQIDLQKAQYDLERMQNQRTILQYSEDKGMHYVSDTSGIRDAKDAVNDAKREIEIADKEKQIALIEDEISLLETRKSLIEDQQADLDNQINALDEYYKKLIENTEAYYSALIQPIENYKTQFESIAEIESDATFDEQLKSLGYSVDEILALSSSTLENFKSNYLGILSDIYAGNSQMLDSLSMISGLDQDSFVGYLSQSQPYIDSLARLDLSSTQLAIDSANSGIHSFADGAVLATTNMTTMADTVTSLLEGDKKQAGIISGFETMTSVLADANTQIAGIASGMEELDGKTATIRINIETNGDTSLLGNAHVSGTAITGASHVEGTALASGNWAVQSNEKNALVGEIGRELIVRGGRFFTVGNYGAEMFNIKKGDIVFNHEQTEALLKNGHISGRGKAYADGSVGGGKILTSYGQILRPLQQGGKMYDLIQKFDMYMKNIDGNLKQLVPGSFYEHSRQVSEMINHMTNSNIVDNRNIQPVINNEINVTLPNVTNSTSAETLLKDLQSLGTKKFQVNW